jgi:hypothetical protein
LAGILPSFDRNRKLLSIGDFSLISCGIELDHQASDGPRAGLRLRPTRIGFAQVSLNKSSAKEEEFLTTVLQRFLGHQHG